MNLYAVGTAHRRQKARRKKNRGKGTGPETKLEHPEFPVDLVGRNEARLIYDSNEIVHLTHPHLNKFDANLMESIDIAFYDQDFSGLNAVIAYDPSTKGPFRFLSIARRHEAAKLAIRSVPGFEIGSGESLGSLWNPNPWHPERVTGKRYAVPTKDFMNAEPPEGMCYVKVEGLGAGRIEDDNAMMAVICCADAFFPPKEE